MVEGIDRFLLRETQAALQRRAALWKRDTSSAARYGASVAGNRDRLGKILGVVDARDKVEALELVATTAQPALVGRGRGYEVYAVRWPAIPGVWGEGLMLVPQGRDGQGAAVADVVAIPDADQTPEMLCGLTPGVAAASQFARRLAEAGCRVVVPALVDRADTYSVTGAGRKTNQPHREFVYRPAFEMGRHVIGYEVQKVLAAVDFFTQQADGRDASIGVMGYGEGGMLALYAAALDTRVDAVCVSGYFDSRQDLWREPIYRNVFSLLHEFGDAEVASLVAPRAVVVEACVGPQVEGPPAPRQGRTGAAPGRLTTPKLDSVREEVERARSFSAGLDPAPPVDLVVSGDGTGPFGADAAVRQFASRLGGKEPLTLAEPAGTPPEHLRKDFDPQPRLRRQIEQMLEHTQAIMRESEYTRRQFWEKADRKARSPEKWKETAEWYRSYFSDEVIGRFDHKLLDPKPRTRRVYDEPAFTGYEVMLDVFPDVFAQGILLLPKGIKEGERRPVVVCQHGLEGRPTDVADPKKDHPAYHRYACKLAERGFVVYAPQNPYIFEDRFRTLQRKANPLKKTLFSIIVPQHRQTTDWLASLPFVDPDRIAFYGLSYGGKTAMRVPALVERYCLSICSADFNEWIWKNASVRAPYSYVGTGEYEIFEWDLGNTFNYAEMAGLIAPRPFMVERGHRDGVGPDEWVAYEFAKVRQLYVDLKIADRTTIEFFDGPHTINGVGTFEFLHEQLKWPKR
jgi:dienelactone hydrolase